MVKNFLSKLSSLFNQKDLNERESSLNIAQSLKDFVEEELLPGLNFTPNYFWMSLENIIEKFSNRNKDLLSKRVEIQKLIDSWHIERKNSGFDNKEYKDFLIKIGYLAPRSKDFLIETKNVDPEIRKIAGPQLVVPVMNARFALNATNARWGSLYDALYGTDIISEADGAEKIGGYNQIRGDKVISFAKKFLDDSIPLEKGNYSDVIKFEFTVDSQLKLILKDQSQTSLKNNDQYICLLYTSPSPRDH